MNGDHLAYGIVWAPACGLAFQKVETETDDRIVIGFETQDDTTAVSIFDGPGGALAKVRDNHTISARTPIC